MRVVSNSPKSGFWNEILEDFLSASNFSPYKLILSAQPVSNYSICHFHCSFLCLLRTHFLMIPVFVAVVVFFRFFITRRMDHCSNENPMASQLDILRCPFLRNINEPTNLSFSSSLPFPMPVSSRWFTLLAFLAVERFSSHVFN